jgi:hypothetical protein
MYETVHTALLVIEHDVVPNLVACRSTKPNVFQSAVEAAKITAAAACYWFSELYNRAPTPSTTARLMTPRCSSSMVDSMLHQNISNEVKGCP